MAESALNLTDPDVRAMARRNHQPDEMWTFGGDVMVICETCKKDWRCPTRLALDAWEREEKTGPPR
jgi:hypothetical protein